MLRLTKGNQDDWDSAAWFPSKCEWKQNIYMITYKHMQALTEQCEMYFSLHIFFIFDSHIFNCVIFPEITHNGQF